jgi:uncharacterized membrane protein
MRAETAHAVILLGIIAGLAFATFSWYESTHPGAEGVCSVNAFVSCAKIDQSGQTTTFGIQDYDIGIAGFLLMLALDIPLYRTWHRTWLYALTIVSMGGALVSVYLAYVELAVIRGLCLICTGAYLSNVVVLAFLLYLVRLGRQSAATAAAGRPAPTTNG